MVKTTIQEQDGNVVAILEGSLDTAAAPETEKAMSPLNDVEGKDIVIDCTALEYISSAGLRIFLGIRKDAAKNGSRVIVRNINTDIRQVFMMTGFISLFEIQ